MSTPDHTRPLSADLGLEDRPARPDADSGPSATDADGRRAGGPPAPVFRSGPAPFALVLGTLGLLTAVLCGVSLLVDVSVPWGDIGPWVVVGGGLLVLLAGAIGLRGSRSQD